MKKVITIAAMLFATVVSAQEYAKVDFAPNMVNTQGSGSAYEGGLTVGKFIDTQWFVEGKVGLAEIKQSTDVATSLSATLGYNVTNWGFVRGGVAHNIVSSVDTYNTYTFGGGVNLPLASQLTAFGSIDRTIAFDNVKPAYTTYEGGVEFGLDKKNAVGLSYVDRRGDVDSHGLKFGYTHKF